MAGEPESLDIEEPLERRRHRHWFDRLIMLSDGVFAIAVTLLAFDLHGPASWRNVADIWAVLVPQLDAYALSFLVIAVYWLAHRRFLAMIVTIDAPLTVLNLFVLALVALLPAATKLVHGAGSVQPAMVIYAALVVAIGLALAAMWGYAALIADLVSSEVKRRVRWFLLGLIGLTPPLFLALVGPLRRPPHGLIPALLALMFLVGWRLRLSVLKRLQG
ncbi:MAG TPA: TMEM175 family protein [Caulobacteraceae bacterium]|nr:TMEM175 family protein [Caulobacteraceae bacterium]